VQEQTQVVGHFGVAVVFGLIIFVMIESFGNISGAHFNPAVTLALAMTKKFSWKQIPLYILAQSMGAFLAITILKFMFPMSKTLGATLPNMHLGSEIISFVIEFLLTFILVLVILQIIMGEKPKDISIGLTIGGVVLLEVMFAGPISGGSLNPIRSLAPAILSGQTTALWVYLLGPTLGAISAVPIWSFFNSSKE
jgi:aquaporin Z